ncbi:hypothetical protein [Endozoicomonas arenosclerae]|uniref:hypothetical protein n=1 Tax=Endozoicomonas arenosclerae TaxID=1633495 RepID=UPI0007821B49|nr:hypothetical protein [Endozoicomonas arenosclerae]
MLNVNNKLIIAVLSLIIVAVISLPALLLVILPVAVFFSLQQWFELSNRKPVRIKAEVHTGQERGPSHERR